jgi:hypothetical protein
MKFALLVFAGLLSFSAFATVDGHDRAWIVVQNIQDEEDFFLERGPFVGCYGLAQGARLVQWTAPYKVLQNIGCGGVAYEENINALTCAVVTDSKESSDYNSFSEITLDISKCPYKNNKLFITMVRTSAARNFPQTNKNKEVVLKLVK